MLAGISTATLYPELLECALDKVCSYGVQSVEVFVNSFSELEDAYLRGLARRASDSGTQILSVHPFTSGLEPILFFSDYRRRLLDGIEFYKQYFHAANILGADILVFHGNRRESIRTYSEYFDLFGELALVGKAMGVTVAQENVPRCTGWCPEFFTAMAQYLPEARFVLDIKQCVRAGYPVETMVDAMGERIIHVHISDHDAHNDCLPVGKGTLDLQRLLEQLASYGFDGGVILELYRQNYGGYEELYQSYKKILSAIAAQSR